LPEWARTFQADELRLGERLIEVAAQRFATRRAAPHRGAMLRFAAPRSATQRNVHRQHQADQGPLHDGESHHSAPQRIAPIGAAAHRYATRQKTRLVVPMKRQISVLDHGHIALVDSMGGDLSIVRAARVSYDAAWRAGDDAGSDARLIRYMLTHGHSTPFEHVKFTFDVMAPIFVFRQWHRYRAGWSFNEVSGRYSELPELFYLPTLEQITTQSAHNKQARSAEHVRYPGDAQIDIADACKGAFFAYRKMLADGVAREIARTVLPLGTYSKMFATTNLHALFHFMDQRLDPHAQFEIRVYAEAMLELVRPIAPVAVSVWEEGRAK
jgi:thymidylate synthase (FAD)